MHRGKQKPPYKACDRAELGPQVELQVSRRARIQKPHWVHRTQLGAAVLYSAAVSGTYTTLASPDHFLLDICYCSISKVGRWCRTKSWAKTWIHMPWFPSCNLTPRTTLCHTSVFLCVLWVSPLKYTETLVWTELQSPQREGHSKAPHTNSGRNCWGCEDPSNTFSFDTNNNGSFSGDDQVFGLTAQKGFALRPQAWKAKQNMFLAYLQLLSRYFPPCCPKFPSTLAGETSL